MLASHRTNTRSQKVTRFIFWIAFISFLSMSIPHVAWLYDLFEPSGNIPLLVVSYGIAVGIDVMICWLSYTLASGEKRTERFTAWVFIGSLSLLSWYANYLYSIAHEPMVHGDIWNVSIFWGMTTTGYITPLIISAIPLFSIAYTFMLSRISKGESIEEMRARLQDEQARREVQQQFDELCKGRFTNKMKEGLTGLFEVTKHAVKEASAITAKDEPRTAMNGSSAPQGDQPSVTREPIREPYEPLGELDELLSEPDEPQHELDEPQREPNELQEIGKMGSLVQRFIDDERSKGHEPTITEIMNHTGCSKGTASKYKNRTEPRAQLRIV